MWSMLATRLTDRLGIEWPVIGAPMIGAAGPALARAVSSAGALGMVGISTVARLEDLEAEMRP